MLNEALQQLVCLTVKMGCKALLDAWLYAFRSSAETLLIFSTSTHAAGRQ